MSKENEKIIDAIFKLIKLTQDGKLKWSVTTPRASLNRDKESIVDNIYYTL